MLKALVGSFAAFSAALFLSAVSVSAQAWPGSDVVARMLQPSLEKSLKRDRAKSAETAKAAGAKID